MRTLRHLGLVLLFAGLIALEIAHGFVRWRAVRERRLHEALSAVERGHDELALDVRKSLEEKTEHAAFLARMPAVRALLEGRPAARKALETEVLPYVVSFRGIDRVRVLDLEGREAFRVERIGSGAGAIPEPLLDPEPDPRALALARGAPPGEVALSELVMDRLRVEVPESDRQVLHFATGVDAGARRLGYLALTVYAAPVLSRIRSFRPFEAVSSSLVDSDGTYLASAARHRERGSPAAGRLQEDYPGAAEIVLGGAERTVSSQATLLSHSAGGPGVSWRIVTAVPAGALDRALGDLRGEYAWIVASMVTTTVLLAAAGAFLVRMSVREVKLREAARFREKEKEIERRLEVSERMGSLGLLTAGVAHEINNPLEGIENYLTLLEREQASPEKRKRYIDMVRYGFHRIRDIVRDLSAFSKPSVGPGSTDLAAVVRQALRMVQYSKELKRVKVDISGFEGPLVVPGDGGRLEQVFINLFLNAAKAMKGEGTIAVAARPVAAEGRGPEVEVQVDDTGPGIPEADLRRIFDPFFSTGDGTGLGLSISYGIVAAHGGSIEAANRPGGGARFTLRLPAVATVELAAARAGRNGP
ncbi:MAG: hypothetical protein HY721_30980 [Planctomycetes bacterium]|nr:hypothetical protein [Planctomycetota bacterium]